MEKITIIIVSILCIFTYPIFTSSAYEDMSPVLNPLPINEDREFYYKEFETSAYTLREEETDSDPLIGASGINLAEVDYNTFASNALPLGAVIELDGELWINQDRMAKRYNGNYLDLCFKFDLEGAREFGRKNLIIKIYK